jgi:hypothetical protein
MAPKKEFYTAEWFPYYHERFEASDKVALMNCTEEGAYHRAIRQAWKHRDISASPEVFAAKMRCSVKVAEKVLRTFVADPDDAKRVIHPVVEEIRAEQHQKHLNRVKGGKASGEARKITGANKGTSNNAEQWLNNTSQERDIDLENDLKNSLPTHASEGENPAVAIYREFYPEASLGLPKQMLIEDRVDNLIAWRKTLTYWRDNEYRANSVGKMIDCMHEGGYERNERSNGSNKAADTGRRHGQQRDGDGGGSTEEYLRGIGARPKRQ